MGSKMKRQETQDLRASDKCLKTHALIEAQRACGYAHQALIAQHISGENARTVCVYLGSLAPNESRGMHLQVVFLPDMLRCTPRTPGSAILLQELFPLP